MHGYWSLVIFTLLGQAAAGMLILSFFSRTADTSRAKAWAACILLGVGALASLELAQQFVDQNELEKAAAQLQQGLAATSDENLKAVINLRLARVQVQLKQADTALKTLDTVKGEGWAAIVADLRGEALLSKGDKQGARSAWEAGVKSDASPALSEMMQMKINNLSI